MKTESQSRKKFEKKIIEEQKKIHYYQDHQKRIQQKKER